MRIRITISAADKDQLKERIFSSAENIESETQDDQSWTTVSPWFPLGHDIVSDFAPFQVLLIDPSQFRILNSLLEKEVKGQGHIETLTFAASQSS